jgi:hypothetical protein
MKKRPTKEHLEQLEQRVDELYAALLQAWLKQHGQPTYEGLGRVNGQRHDLHHR